MRILSSIVIFIVASLLILMLLVATVGAAEPVSLTAAPPPAPTVRQRIALGAALVGESAKFYPGSFNPGVIVGADVPWVVRRGHAFVQTASLGYFHHADLAHALTLQSEVGYRHTFRVGVVVDLLLGLALLHKFPTQPAYALEDGRYRRDDSGASSFMPSLAAGIGYDLSRHKAPLTIFARYQLGVEVPGVYGVPVYPHTQILIGARVRLSR